VLDALLDNYADEGIESLENAKVLKLKPFSDMGTPMEIINKVFGGKANYEKAVLELEKELFKQEKSA
jgi:type I restriction enzyme R subunit